MSSWSCRYELKGICKKVAGAYCRPGIKGCILVGKVKFQDGQVPAPVWPPGAGPGNAPADAAGSEPEAASVPEDPEP
ncbi:hypothetical protein PSR1_01001 [Anaeromyxobacter sp. PSR-1]|nr:hypothetical protein PSR1_01001 [Anaeromyxobacter sp. PSR-1]